MNWWILALLMTIGAFVLLSLPDDGRCLCDFWLNAPNEKCPIHGEGQK
jgi:hypothetical protein